MYLNTGMFCKNTCSYLEDLYVVIYINVGNDVSSFYLLQLFYLKVKKTFLLLFFFSLPF